MSLQPHVVVAAILVTVFVLAMIVCWIIYGLIRSYTKKNPRQWYNYFADYISWWFGLWSSVVAVVMILIAVCMYIPYNSFYYYNYTKTGVVEKVQRNDALGDFIVTISGYKHPLYVDDARLLDLKGTTQSFFCTPNWQYNAQPYFSCEISTKD